MSFDLDKIYPWLMLAVGVLWLYRSARIYLKTRLVTAKLCGFIAFAVAFGGMGVAQFYSLSRGSRVAANLVGFSSFMVALLLLSNYGNEIKAKPPA